MAVYHVLKNGEIKTDITGHVVRMADAETLYRFIHSINRESRTNQNPTYKLNKMEERTYE